MALRAVDEKWKPKALDARSEIMPLTPIQKKIACLLSQNRSPESHLAGGAALHFEPNSIRYSKDLDYFHDSEQHVSSAFAKDHKLLVENGYKCVIEMNQPGYIRCVVQKDNDSTKVEWACDSMWKFMPVQFHQDIGYMLHPIDLAINKVLALAGRDEPRDYLDVLHAHEKILPLGAMIWATCGKDPGFSPGLLMDLLKRHGKYQEEDFLGLHLSEKVDLHVLKQKWLKALEGAEVFIREAPPHEIGCLYYSRLKKTFVEPDFQKENRDIVCHYGSLGGIIPKVSV